MSFERIAGIAGLAGAGLWLISFGLLAAPPEVGASPQEVLEFASREQGSLIAYVYLADVLPAFGFLTLGVGLWQRLRPDAGWAMLGLLGMASMAIAMFGWGITDALLAVQGDRGADLATIENSFELYNIGHIPAHASIAVLVAAFGIAGRRAALFPRWATPLGVFAAVAAVAVIPAGFVANDALETLHLVSILAFVVWIGMAATRLLRIEPSVAEGKVMPAELAA